MKKLLGILVALVLLCAAGIAAAEIASGDTGYYVWRIDDAGTLTISAGKMSGNPYPHPWNEYADQVQQVVIADGVDIIPYEAFRGFTRITALSFPDSVMQIGYSVAQGCTALQSVRFPQGQNVSIDSNAFMGCTALKSVDIPEGVTSIGMLAFYGCTSLTQVSIPSTASYVGNSFDAFSGCTSLESISIAAGNPNFRSENGLVCSKDLTTLYLCPRGRKEAVIPNGVQTVSFEAFYQCAALKRVQIPKSVTSLGGFIECTALESLTIPDSVTELGACNGCAALREVRVGAGVQELPVNAFEGCAALTKVTLPKGLKAIPQNAFSGCAKLPSVTIPDSVTSVGVSAFDSCSSLETISLPDGVTSIGDFAFYECFALRSVHMPAGLKSLGHDTFKDCQSLSGAFTIPKGVKRIEAGTFFGCSSLTKISLSKGLREIGPGAFTACGLESIDLPDTVTRVGSNAFLGCTRLMEMTIRGMNVELQDSSFPEFTESLTIRCYKGSTAETIAQAMDIKVEYLDGDAPETPPEDAFTPLAEPVSGTSPVFTWSIDTDGTLTISGRSANSVEAHPWTEYADNVRRVVLSDGLEIVVDEAFLHFTHITEITIPDTVRFIGNHALEGCTALKTVRLPQGLSSGVIGAACFRGCSSLESLVIPEGFTSMAGGAFQNCGKLKSVSLPASLTSWEPSGAFLYCKSLSTLTVAEGNTSFAAVDNVLFSKDGTVLYACPGAKGGNYKVPDGVTRIESSAFRANDNLKTVRIPASVQSIGMNAFCFCNALTEVTILSRDAMIESGAFDKCRNLTIACYTGSTAETYAKEYSIPCRLLDGVPAGPYSDGSGKYTITAEGTATFKKPAKSAATVKVPDTIKVSGQKVKVTAIAANAFKGSKRLKSVTIGRNVKTIGKNAFLNCTKLKTVTGMANVTTIGASAFQGCKALAKITLPARVKTIGAKAFYKCAKLKTITIKTTKLTTKTVGANAFKGIYKKATVKVPAKKVKAYKTLLAKKGLPKTAKVKK